MSAYRKSISVRALRFGSLAGQTLTRGESLASETSVLANRHVRAPSTSVQSYLRVSAEISGTHIHQTLCFTYNNSEASSKKYIQWYYDSVLRYVVSF